MKKNIKFLVLLGIGILYFILGKLTGIYIPCFIHEVTGLYCPGCGISRMIINLCHLNFEKAYYCNQLLFISTPIFLFLIIDTFISNIRDVKPIYKKIPNTVYYVYIVLLILFMIIRNIFPYFAPIGV